MGRVSEAAQSNTTTISFPNARLEPGPLVGVFSGEESASESERNYNNGSFAGCWKIHTGACYV